MKSVTATILLLSVACAAGTQLGSITTSEEDIPDIPWEQIREIVLTRGNGDSDGHIEANVTEYVQKLLPGLQDVIRRNGLDPLILSDELIKLIPTGYVNLTNGLFEDVSTIALYDSVIARYTLKTKILELTLPLTFKSLLINYDYHTQILLLSIRGTVDAKVSKFKLHMHGGFDFNKYHAFVDKFTVKNTGAIQIKFTGLGLLDWVIEILTGVLTTLFHGIILSVIDLVIQSPVNSLVAVLNKAIDEILQHNSTMVFTG